jgi:hypothetical protein
MRLRVECTLFRNLHSRARTHAVLLIGMYELLGNPSTQLIELPKRYWLNGSNTSIYIKYCAYIVLIYWPNKYYMKTSTDEDYFLWKIIGQLIYHLKLFLPWLYGQNYYIILLITNISQENLNFFGIYLAQGE